MVDLDRLDTYLGSDEVSTECMMLSDLDGFLTGIICLPDVVAAEEWFPEVWGADTPPEGDEGQWAMQAIMERYDEILAGLNANPPYFDPVFWEEFDGTVNSREWCEGFMYAYGLHEEKWNSMLETEQGRDLLAPILAHLVDKEGNMMVDVDEGDSPSLIEEAQSLIIDTVPGIYAFWQSRETRH